MAHCGQRLAERPQLVLFAQRIGPHRPGQHSLEAITVGRWTSGELPAGRGECRGARLLEFGTDTRAIVTREQLRSQPSEHQPRLLGYGWLRDLVAENAVSELDDEAIERSREFLVLADGRGE